MKPKLSTFHKTTWSEVRPGDTVLIKWDSLGIIEIQILECWHQNSPLDDAKLVFINFDFDGRSYRGWPYDPDATVYVQRSAA